jgi:hypothetical protein
MFDSILVEASDALLSQQAEIRRLHSIIRWCGTRLAAPRARELEAMLQELRQHCAPGARLRDGLAQGR